MEIREGGIEERASPNIVIRREKGLELISRALKEGGDLEDVEDEESLFMLALVHEHPERSEEIIGQLKRYKPHINNPEKLLERVMEILHKKVGEDEECGDDGSNKWGDSGAIVAEHLSSMINFFNPDLKESKINQVTIVPSDDLLASHSGGSFRVADEIIIISRSDDLDNFDHEFLHGIINPLVEKEIDRMTDEERRQLVELSSSRLRSKDQYGEHPGSLLQETIIRTYVHYIQKNLPMPDMGHFRDRISSLDETEFNKILEEYPALAKQLESMKVDSLEDFKNRCEEFYYKFAQDILRERVYIMLKNYKKAKHDNNKITFEQYFRGHIGELVANV